MKYMNRGDGVPGSKITRKCRRVFDLKNVIHIYGASGSGTSTLGKKICDETGYFFMDTDDYYWLPADPMYTAKRSIPERLALMKKDTLIENVLMRTAFILSKF